MALASVAERVRKICLALPGVTERPSHGAPSFFIQKQFVALWPDGHYDQQFAHLWAAAPPGAQEELATVCEDAYLAFAPKTLLAALEASRAMTKSVLAVSETIDRAGFSICLS